jgi:Glycosyl-transferase for dystroglycan
MDSGNVDEFRKQQQQQQQQLPPKYEELYPINALRNAALDAASTPLVLFADGDFAFSSGLADAIAQPWVQDALCTRDDGALPPRRADMQPRMLVLPAFQLNLPEALPDSAVQYKTAPTTAAELAAALACGDAVPFHCGPFAPHTPLIDPATWLAADELLECAYDDRCEPQGIAAAATLPRWDERFW